MDRLWEALVTAPWRPFPSFRRTQTLPAMDVFEKEGQLHVRAELPGIDQKDVEVEISGDTLTISGEKKEQREVKEENYYRSERSYGKFSRQVALPAGADTTKAAARFKDGILEIDIPVKQAADKQKIQIQPGT
jgi:HSP20 family protein